MRRRLIVVLAAVIPLAALVIAVAVSGGGPSKQPAKLPVAYGSGGAQATSAKATDAAFAPGSYPYGGVTYVAAADLPDLGGNARAYQVVSDVTDASIRSLADALGVQGDPVEQSPGYVTVGDGDRQLSIERATGSWYLSGMVSSGVAVSSGAGYACPVNADGSTIGSTSCGQRGSGYACPAVAPGEPPVDCPMPPEMTTTIPTRPADLPSQDEAKAKALDLLRATGMDVGAAHVTIDDYTTSWQITVDSVVDGKSAQRFGASVAIGAGGAIDYANGFLAHAAAVDEYPLLTTREAIDLLNKNQVVPMMAFDTATATGGSSLCEETKATTGDGVAVALPCAPTPTTVVCPELAPATTVAPNAASSASDVSDAAFTITNVPPPSVAAYTYTCSAFTCSFDGSTSTNATGYSWNFGDGATASGVTTSHTFAVRKTYTVTLSTTPAGSQSTATKSIVCNNKKCS